MKTSTDFSPQVDAAATDAGGIGGHPRGLTTLFFTELWERFSYYGMRAILVLYMTATLADGGLGFDNKKATSIFGTYTMSVYFTSLPGGWLADRFLGARMAVLIGGIVIACGHFAMAFPQMSFFYGGLVLIALGTGLLKPNISTMVGSLYAKDDPRRDGGFSIFYMGINLGAVMAPLVCGYLAQSAGFKTRIAAWGFNPLTSWHWGFAAAGIGMVLGLVVYLMRQHTLVSASGTGMYQKTAKQNLPQEPLTAGDWKRVGAIFIFFAFTMCFWAAYEQKGASLNLFARDLVRTEIFGWPFPSSWLQSLTGFYVILLAPVFSMLWVKLGDKQPSSPAKFTLGLTFIGLAYLLFVPACMLTAQGKVSPLWLVGLYFLEVVGEMCLSPVGLSTVTKIAPARLLGLMMGVWFLASALGNKFAGFIGGFFDAKSPQTLMTLYGSIAVGLLVAAGFLAALTPTVRRLMGGTK